MRPWKWWATLSQRPSRLRNPPTSMARPAGWRVPGGDQLRCLAGSAALVDFFPFARFLLALRRPCEPLRLFLLLPVAAFGSGVQRSAVRATVLRGEQRIRVYTVHLPSPLGVTGGARRQQLKVLLADAADSTDPVVITGDFNSYDVGKQIVEAGYSWPTRDVGATARFSLFGIRIFGMSIDHIFTRGLEPVSDGDAAGVVQDNRDASDHLPVWAVLATATPDQR
jgi:endonuclease/exonuclease/phosphatase family metal-dependent hydrolase